MGGDGHTFGANLKAARKALGWSQQRLADEASTSKGYISDLERGNRPPPPGKMLEKLAAAVRLPVGTLLISGNIRSVPLISSVTAGGLISPTIQIAGEHPRIEISTLPPGDYFATKVRGDSMDRVSPEGSVVFVNRQETDPLPGRRYIFSRGGETTYKRFERDPLRLVPESTNHANEPIFPKSEEEWIVIGRVRLTLLNDL